MPLPLETLITDRLSQLGINTHGLAARLGYVNTNKGARRLTSLMDGQLAGHDQILSGLASALGVPSTEVAHAVRTTCEMLEQNSRRAVVAAERDYRARFVPHAVILTERHTPAQIAFCAFTRGERALHVDLDLSRPRASYARQAMAEINRRTDHRRREIAFFGPVRRFAVNYAWCRAVRFDLDGRALEFLPRSVRIGTSTWSTSATG